MNGSVLQRSAKLVAYDELSPIDLSNRSPKSDAQSILLHAHTCSYALVIV